MAIAACVLKDLEQLGLDVVNVRGQGYDGASNMSSARVGLQALIREKSPLAVYTHCTGHCLNLVIGSSCSLPVIRGVIDKMKSVCLFFSNSPKRNQLLIEIVEREIKDDCKRAPLIDLCKTRWAARHSAYRHFYCCYKFVVIACEGIGLGLHTDTFSENFCDAVWDPESKSIATSFVHAHANFEFIVTFLIVYQFLSHLAGVTVKLQSRTLDIVDAYKQIETIIAHYKFLRTSIDVEFHKIYLHAERMAVSVSVQPCKPRTCERQRNRPNVATTSIEEWYKVNVAIPFIDHIIADLVSRFSPLARTASCSLCFVHKYRC